MVAEEKYSGIERRQNVRWNQIIPLKFALLDGEKERILGQRQSGVIHNISRQGVCVEINKLDEELKDDLISGKVKLLLEILLPELKKPILALAKVTWLSKLWKEKGITEGEYLAGLIFTDISSPSVDMIGDYILESYVKEIDKGGGRTI